jgi:HNH endonuclease
LRKHTITTIVDTLLQKRHKNPITGCWNWTGGRIPAGYGFLRFQGRKFLVHRFIAYVCLGLNVDSWLYVLHKCDNKRCFNPEHLFVGDQHDNMYDMYGKERHDRDCVRRVQLERIKRASSPSKRTTILD